MDTAGKNKLHPDVIIGVLVDALMLYMFLEARGFRDQAKEVPMILFAAAAVLGTLILINGLVKTKKQGQSHAEAAGDGEKPSLVKPLIYIGFSFLFVFCVNVIGFCVSTAIYMALSLLFLGARNKRTIILLPVVAVAVIYFIFAVELGVHFPGNVLLF